jgi:sterol desaturase/sphingolipid hydroxylase (fatty acid hydroxylase superfamily)
VLGPVDFTALLVIALVFIPLEYLFPARREQKFFRKNWRNDLVTMLANAVAVTFGMVVTFAVMGLLIRLVVPVDFFALVRAQPLWLQVIEVLILADLGFYLAHRAFHAFPFLWRFHSVHHSIEELDWLAAFRVHPVDQILTKSASFLPVLVLGFSEAAILIFAVIYKWQSVTIHSNNRIALGPLRYLFASPLFHHWHHANEPAAIDKNFAGQLPFLDWIFGTLHMPKTMPQVYGTIDPVPLRYDQQLIYPFRAPPAPVQVPVATGTQ